ncbi:hypothetical protein L2E82_27931 [Cichorium intybus]|uniref:Uncharacterized protein n=1 Tax=Cichorium intybus TaxID=13427 RepID=A0ACB9CUM5_CICIN|nr:hypothetical protein L2E82_27931 [Cichorium intybus]
MPGGSCYEPDNVRNHASYAIDLNFRVNGECDTSFATPAVTDPCFHSHHSHSSFCGFLWRGAAHTKRLADSIFSPSSEIFL